MGWRILLYEQPKNSKPVEQFIKKQQPQAQAKIIHKLDLLEQYGPSLGMPHSKKINAGIYELRIRCKKELKIAMLRFQVLTKI